MILYHANALSIIRYQKLWPHPGMNNDNSTGLAVSWKAPFVAEPCNITEPSILINTTMELGETWQNLI